MRNSIIPVLIGSFVSASALADTAQGTAALEVTSSAFRNNGAIPSEYTCEGSEISPPLSWSKVPAGTKSIALLVVDPDAPNGAFTHWLVTGIPPSTTSLDKGAALPRGAVAAKNDRNHAGYTGPCPPAGMHHYEFHVYALDIRLPTAMPRADFLGALRGHTLATGQLVGTYQKQRGR